MEYRVLKFGAEWCGPCRKLAEDLKKHALALDNVTIESINVDDNDEMVDHYGIMNLPTSIIIDENHKVISRKTGYSGINEYFKWIKENVNE